MRHRLAGTLMLLLAAAPVLADKKLDDAVAKAEELLQKGRPDEGLKGLQKVVTAAPTSEGYLALSRFQERLGTLDDAASSALKAAELASSGGAAKSDALVAASSLDLLRGPARDAIAHADEAVKAQPSPAALAALARAQARGQDAPSALASAEKAISAGASSALAHEAKADALLVMRRADEAAASYRKALELDPKLHRARVGLAAALTAAGKGAEAVAEARKAAEADQKNAEAFAILGLALLAENPAKWSDAIAEAQQGAFLNPKSVVVQHAVGRLFEAQGNLDQAATAYQHAFEIDPGYAPVSIALIQVQDRKGDLAGALAAAQKLVAASPKSGEAQLLLGRLLLRKSEFAHAAKALAQAVAAAPGIAEAHAFLGTALQYTGQTPEAVQAYRKAVELDPKNLNYRATYGLLLGLQGEYEQGAAELQKVVSSPGYKDSAGYTNLGWLYRSVTPKKTKEALAAYKKALELDPGNEQAALGLGWAHSYDQAYDQAIPAFEQAIKIEPKTAPEAYNGIAWCHFFKRDMSAAKEALDKAQKAGRSDPRLAENIQKFEKLALQREEYEKRLKELQEEQQRGPDIGGLARQARAGDAAARIRAVRELANAGAQAVPALIGVLADDASPVPVREAAVSALGSMGPGARQALPYLNEILRLECGKTIMDKKEMEESLKCEDLKRKARDVVLKIQK